MKKFSIALFIIALGLVFSAFTVYAEMAKEGSGEYRSAKSGTFEVIKLGEGRLQMNYDEQGAMVDAPENSPFFNSSFRALGTLHAINGEYKSYGSLVFTCPNGDQFFAVIAADGVLGTGPTGGGAEIIGGTGACSGIQGKIDFMPRPAVKSSKQGTYQGIGIGKVSWKIP